MSREEIFNELLTIFKSVIKSDESLVIKEESNLRYDLGINSVGLIYLVIGIEESFDVDMSETSFNSFVSVKDVIDFIKERL